MIGLSLMLASALSIAPAQSIPGRYTAVTETEFAIDLALKPSGEAVLSTHTWEADGSAPPSNQKLTGHWSQADKNIKIRFGHGQSATFTLEACLSYSEFGQSGCSLGLKLVSTNLPARWGLQRFGLWRSDLLRVDR